MEHWYHTHNWVWSHSQYKTTSITRGEMINAPATYELMWLSKAIPSTKSPVVYYLPVKCTVLSNFMVIWVIYGLCWKTPPMRLPVSYGTVSKLKNRRLNQKGNGIETTVICGWSNRRLELRRGNFPLRAPQKGFKYRNMDVSKNSGFSPPNHPF